MLRAAIAELEARPSAARPLGPVVVYLPDVRDGLSTRFLDQLAAAAPVELIVGLTGDETADAQSAQLAEHFGESRPDARPAVPAPTEVLSANDVDDEVRCVVRRLLAIAERGTPLHEMAIVHPGGEPYARAVSDVLVHAGVPHHGPSTETLGHTATGRVLAAVVEVARTGYSRDAVVDLWASGVVVGRDGRLLRSMQLDLRTRRLGIIGGLARWRARLDDRKTYVAAEIDAMADDPEADRETIERRLAARQGELADLEAIEAELDDLAGLIETMPSTWPGVAAWASAAIDRLCLPPAQRYGWSEYELNADAAVRTAMGRLGALEAVEPEPSRQVIVDTLLTALEQPAPRRSRAGEGLLVTSIASPPHTPLAAVAIVGLGEGSIPRLRRDDVLLGESTRADIGLATARSETTRQHRAFLAALHAAPETAIASFPRGDQRSGRTQTPSRWLVGALERATGDRPRAEHLSRGLPVEGVTVVPSFAAGLASLADDGPLAPLRADERSLAALAGVTDPQLHPAADDPAVAAGVELVRSRSSHAFTRFDGNLAGDGVDVLSDSVLSPTSIEQYASCPRRWFFGKALGLSEEDRPEEVDRLQPRDKGTLAHKILERFVDEAITAGRVPAPGQPYSPEQMARLDEIANEEFDDFERRGLVGHPRWWQHDRHEMLAVIRQTIEKDLELRAINDSTPIAVEFTFGRNGKPPLSVRLPDGREVRLAGQADRVDRTGDGRMLVYDYKYSSSYSYRSVSDPDADPLMNGTKLQLMVYSQAIEQAEGVDRSGAYYWFLKPGHTGKVAGYELDDQKRRQFAEALQVMVNAISEGLFPARSGEYDSFFGRHANCGFCDFNAICPADRPEEWERVRDDASLADLVAMAERGTNALLERGAHA